MKKKILTLTLVLIGAAMFAIAKYALADTFDLSYSLTEGGYRLELDPANPHKGVKLDIASDVAVRYEIIQKIVKPLEDRENPGMVIQDNFVLRGIRGTNRFGTLHVPVSDMGVRSNEILYTSDVSGNPDSLTLAYGLVNIDKIQAGHYYGKISFTLQPIDSTRSPQTEYLDVYVTISEEQGAKPSIEITTASGSSIITLNSKRENAQSADILVKVNGVFRNLFSLTQGVTRPLESPEGNQLNYEVVNFVVREVEKGTSTNQVMPLSPQPQTIYTSKPSGETDESFIITYSLGDLSGVPAGKYSSNLQYFLEEAGEARKSQGTFRLEVENEQTLELTVTPQDEEDIIEFRNLKPQEGPKVNAVTLEIKTNIRKFYQVSQNVFSALTNKEGNIIPEEYFTLRTESLETKGTLKFPKPQIVKKGETVLFVSDNQGSSDKFKVIYELTPSMDLKASTYSTRIVYSLSEI